MCVPVSGRYPDSEVKKKLLLQVESIAFHDWQDLPRSADHYRDHKTKLRESGTYAAAHSHRQHPDDRVCAGTACLQRRVCAWPAEVQDYEGICHPLDYQCNK